MKLATARKSSGIDWIGTVPADWDIKALKWSFNENKQTNHDGSEFKVLSLSYGRIVTRDVESNHGLLPESFSSYQVVRPGYLVLRLTDLQNDKRSLRVGLATEKGIITSAYVGLIPGAELDSRFAHYLLHSYDLTKVFYGLGGGLRQSMKFEDLSRLPILLPHLGVQKAIANFLDRKTAAVDALIAKKRRLVELLAEKRAALINQAVTKGLDPTAPVKDSGIPWIGEIPAHWEIVTLRRTLRKVEQGWSPQCDSTPVDGDDWGVLKSGCTAGGCFNASSNKSLPAGLEPRPELQVREGDVLVSRASGSPEIIGSAALVPLIVQRLILSDKLFRLRLRSRLVTSAFLVKALGSRSARAQIENMISGAEGLANNLPQARLKDLVLVLPPIGEQIEIARDLDEALVNIDKTRISLLKHVDRIQEYRQALITAAVTGQLEIPVTEPEEVMV